MSDVQTTALSPEEQAVQAEIDRLHDEQESNAVKLASAYTRRWTLRERRKTPEQKVAETATYAKALDDSIAAETDPNPSSYYPVPRIVRA